MDDKDTQKEPEAEPKKKKITLKPAGFKAFSDTMGSPPRPEPKK